MLVGWEPEVSRRWMSDRKLLRSCHEGDSSDACRAYVPHGIRTRGGLNALGKNLTVCRATD